MDQFDRILLVIGTFLPILGVVLTIFLAIVLSRWWRVAALALTPLLTYGLCDYFGRLASVRNHNAQQEYYLTDVIALAASDGVKTGKNLKMSRYWLVQTPKSRIVTGT